MESMAPDTEALYRCDESTTRPFCGGTHAAIGIRAAQKAVRREEGEV
jgi:CDGSH-type Zn-finger protein